MTANDLKLVAGALDHYAHGNPGNSPEGEIERVVELALHFWGEAEAKERIERGEE